MWLWSNKVTAIKHQSGIIRTVSVGKMNTLSDNHSTYLFSKHVNANGSISSHLLLPLKSPARSSACATAWALSLSSESRVSTLSRGREFPLQSFSTGCLHSLWNIFCTMHAVFFISNTVEFRLVLYLKVSRFLTSFVTYFVPYFSLKYLIVLGLF